MPFYLSKLKKLSGIPMSALLRPRDENETMVVIVRLHPGMTRPDYLTVRSEFSPDMFSSTIVASDLLRMDDDPAVASVALSGHLPLVG